MIDVPNYRGFRIEITAQPVGDAWDAGVRIRCPRSKEVRREEYIPCRKSSAVEAEHAADMWARRLMDGMARLARVARIADQHSGPARTLENRSLSAGGIA